MENQMNFNGCTGVQIPAGVNFTVSYHAPARSLVATQAHLHCIPGLLPWE
jgi:hypothetical protein